MAPESRLTMGHEPDAFSKATEKEPRKTKSATGNRAYLRTQWMLTKSRFISSSKPTGSRITRWIDSSERAKPGVSAHAAPNLGHNGDGNKRARLAFQRNTAHIELGCRLIGGRGRNRTFNLSVKSRMLCQLSYASTEWITMQAGIAGTASARKPTART